MDALLIVCFNSRFTHFLARADIFKKPFTRWLLTTLNMVPIYRIRDGWHSLSENQKTFEACYQIFTGNEAIVIFPEGNHGDLRRLRPLSKGFARIAFEALQKDPELKISVVPVGLNYSDHKAFRGSVSIYFGKPLLANDYFKENLPSGAGQLRDDLSFQLKKLITHVENASDYNSIIQKLDNSSLDFLDPVNTNLAVSKIENGEKLTTGSSSIKKNYGPGPLHYLALTINFIPLMLWKKISSGIKDPVFVTSLKFGVGIFLFPFFYLLISLIAYSIWGAVAAFGWVVISFPSMLFYRK